MKTSLIAGLFALVTWQVAGQGTVNFANGAAGVDAPVLLANAALEGPEWQAELLLVSRGGALQRIGQPVFLETLDLAGYFFGGLVVVPGVEAGSEATLKVRAFSTAGNGEVYSNAVKITLGGGIVPPPNLVGLETWGINAATPELAISLSQTAVTLSWPKEFPNAALEFTENLASSNWSAAPATPQNDGTRLTVTVPVATAQRFYRLRLK